MERPPWPAGAILRDIARGGIAGLLVAVVVGGVGGRLVMRLAALLVPAAAGSLTENGNVIGAITLEGTVPLVVFVGLAGSVFLATLWVVIAPWLPGTGRVRGLAAVPVAVALGGVALVQGDNVDFVVLRHDPLVVAILVGLVALVGPAMAVVDGWLDRHLPAATRPRSPATLGYGILAAIGLVLAVALVVGSASGGDAGPLLLTVIACGACTLAWWALRLRGVAAPPPGLRVAGRAALAAGTLVGLVALVPHVAGALDIG